MHHPRQLKFRSALCLALIACFLAGVWPPLGANPCGASPIAAGAPAANSMRTMACCKPGACHCCAGKKRALGFTMAADPKSGGAKPPCLCQRSPGSPAPFYQTTTNREIRIDSRSSWTARPVPARKRYERIVAERLIVRPSAPLIPPPEYSPDLCANMRTRTANGLVNVTCQGEYYEIQTNGLSAG